MRCARRVSRGSGQRSTAVRYEKACRKKQEKEVSYEKACLTEREACEELV